MRQCVSDCIQSRAPPARTPTDNRSFDQSLSALDQTALPAAAACPCRSVADVAWSTVTVVALNGCTCVIAELCARKLWANLMTRRGVAAINADAAAAAAASELIAVNLDDRRAA